MKEQIDIGIITVIPTEIQAIKKVLNLSSETEESEFGFVKYFKGSFYSKISNREITVVVTYLNKEAGNTEAAITTKHFLYDWYPKIMCLVGIAAGLKGAVKIADVVIPNQVIDRSVKTYKEMEYRPRSTSYPRSDMINSELKKNPINLYDFRETCSLEFKEEIEKALITARNMGIPEKDFDGKISVQDGSLWTDNTLIRDISYFEGYSKFDDKCRGGEMESGGFIRACQVQRSTLPWIVFRGISDFGDKNKSDDFQLLAAQCAAAAFREVFSKCVDVDLIENDPRVNIQEKSLQIDIIKQIRDAYNAKRWKEVCRIAPIISRYLWVSGQHSLRIEVGRMVIESAKQTHDEKTRCAFLVDDIGWTLYSIGETGKDEAISNIHDGLRIADDIKDYYICAKAHRHLASIARRDKQYEEAETELNKAKATAKKISSRDKKAEIETSLIFSRLKLSIENEKNETKWKEEAEEAINRFKALGDSNREVKIYNYIGRIYLKKGDIINAEDSFEHGLQLAYQIGRYDAVKENSYQLIELHADNPEKKKQYIERVIEFCKSQKLFSEIIYWKKINGGELR